MAGQPTTNHIADPWPSVVGTAVHAWLADAFTADNTRHGVLRWVAEQRVTPHPNHPGTADLYDAAEQAVVDHKVLGESSLTKVQSLRGPPRKYVVQLLLYGLGYRNLGLPVRRVALAAYPRTQASLDGLYVWDREYSPADDELLREVFHQTDYRQQWANRVISGQLDIKQIPRTPSHDECYFCLAGETEVVTRDGIRPIRELAGTTHNLLVPSARPNGARGQFVSVPVRVFGVQRLSAVHLRRYRATKTIYATPEHRWITADGAVVTTAELQTGVQLASVRAEPTRGARPISAAIAQGFTYGDGARGINRRPATLAIYRRSHKRALLPHFGPIEVREYATPDGDTVDHIYGLPRFWKALPPLDESRSFLLSWLIGYFAADGSVTEAGQCELSSANRESLLFVRDLAAACGIGYGSIATRSRFGKNTKPTDLYTIGLNARDLPDWFWILPHHRQRVAERVEKAERITHWSVVDIKPTNRIEEVYCATVPGIGAFALVDGLTTGNCPFYRPDAHDGGAQEQPHESDYSS